LTWHIPANINTNPTVTGAMLTAVCQFSFIHYNSLLIVLRNSDLRFIYSVIAKFLTLKCTR
jgi:hypothetical protein